MDHGGHFEREGSIMSQVQMGGVDLCDNLSSSEALTALTQNLNETRTLAHTQSLSLLAEGEGTEGRDLILKASLSSNEEAAEKGGGTGGDGVVDEEEDVDEVMMEEEEEVSEGSSSLIRCQSPDTPMTDSSYSETGSLLETPYPFSPGTSPESASPVLPPISPETSYTTNQGALSPDDVKVESNTSNTESAASSSGYTTLGQALPSMTSCGRSPSPPGPTCITDAAHSATHRTFISEEHFTSPGAGRITSAAEMFTATSCATRPTTSTTSTPISAATGPRTFATQSTSTGLESSSFTGPVTSTYEHNTSTSEPTGFSVSACAAGPVQSSELLESLEQLAQRGDDTHLPQYLHQIAEAFVLNEDYQQALWCIQLERLYHQRVLDNLNALQGQWESQCKRTFPDQATKPLDTLQHICQTHSRPRARDAVCASLDILRRTSEDRVEEPPCTAAHQDSGRMEQTVEDSSHFESSHPVVSSHNLDDEPDSPDTSEKDRGDLESEPDGRGGFHGSQLTCIQGREGGIRHTTSAIGNEVHPSATGRMEQSKSAEQQGGDHGLARERKADEEVEESVEEEVAKALEMQDEGEDEEEEKLTEGSVSFHQHVPIPVDAAVREADVEEQQLHQEAQADEKLHEDSQENSKSLLQQEAHLLQEAHMKQQEEEEAEEEEEQEEEEEEEEEEYEVQQADIIREAASLDDMAKLITVEEISPASGLVSILKKRGASVDDTVVFASSVPQAVRTPAKRRVRFRVPDDGFEHDVGGGDSCLLLFLLCLVTVVISLGGTALYCALGDAHSSVCRDFSKNADFYIGQIQRGISHIQHWFTAGS